MKVKLLLIGRTEAEYLRTGVSEYETRIRRYIPFEITEIPGLKNAANYTPAEQMAREADLVRKQLAPGDILVVLDERGRETDSPGFADLLNRHFSSGMKRLVFLVGGPFGTDPLLRSEAAGMLSLSRMTFSHQMVRLFFVEQLYRALTILKGESYHHA